MQQERATPVDPMVTERRITITVGFPSLFCQPLVENPYNGRHFGIHSKQQFTPIRISPGYKNSITYVPNYMGTQLKPLLAFH